MALSRSRTPGPFKVKRQDRSIMRTQAPASPISSWILAMIFLHGILVWSEVPRTVPSSRSGNNVIRLVFKLQIILKQGSHSVLSHTSISALSEMLLQMQLLGSPSNCSRTNPGTVPNNPQINNHMIFILVKIEQSLFSAVTTHWPLRFHAYAI